MQKQNKSVAALLVLAALLGTPVCTRGAYIVMDDFTEGPIDTGTINDSLLHEAPDQTGLDPDKVIGGERYFSSQRTGTGRYSVNLDGGYLDIGQVTASTVTYVLQYGRTSDLNVDLSEAFFADGSGRGFAIWYDLINVSGSTLTIDIFTRDFGTSSTGPIALQETLGTPSRQLYDFDRDFTGSAVLTDIDKITFTFRTTQEAADISLAFLSAGTIPEPHTAVMLLMAGGIIRVLRRRKFQAVHG